jgi:signal transduction histidine kinase
MLDGFCSQALDALLHSGGGVLYLELDAAGRVRRASPFTTQLLGRDPTGLGFREVIVDFGNRLDPFDLASQGACLHTLGISTWQGLPQDVRCCFVGLDDAVIVVGTIDVEAQSGLQKQLLGLNRQLANLSRDLQKSNAELAQLNQLKTQFLGMASHDLRNPLNAVLSLAEIVLEEADTTLSADHARLLQQIIESGRYMQRILSDFLDVSVLESGRVKLDLQAVEIARLAERVVASTATAANRKGVSVDLVLEAPLPAIAVDPVKVEQALTNLVTNAVEHSHPGSRVAVRIASSDTEVVLEVTDRGVGIPAEAIPELFTPFPRYRSRKTGGEKSIGLGLSIARGMVEAHGGRIDVQSQAGSGSIFTVVLPRSAS